MSHLKNKSINNKKAAKFLINKKYYNSSIHCSYYSTFQYIKNTLCHIAKIDYPKQESLLKDETYKNIKGGSHSKLIRIFKDNLNFNNIHEITNLINYLKTQRVDADYKNMPIDKEQAKNALKICNNIQELIDKNFK